MLPRRSEFELVGYAPACVILADSAVHVSQLSGRRAMPATSSISAEPRRAAKDESIERHLDAECAMCERLCIATMP